MDLCTWVQYAVHMDTSKNKKPTARFSHKISKTERAELIHQSIKVILSSIRRNCNIIEHRLEKLRE